MSSALVAAPILGFLLFWLVADRLKSRFAGFDVPNIRLLFGLEGAGLTLLVTYALQSSGL